MSLRRHVRLRNQAHRGRNRQRTGHPRQSTLIRGGFRLLGVDFGHLGACRLEAALIRNIGHQLVMLFGDVFLGNLIGSPLPRNVPCQRNGHAAIDVIDRRGLDWLACLGGCRIAHIRANVALDILRDGNVLLGIQLVDRDLLLDGLRPCRFGSLQPLEVLLGWKFLSSRLLRHGGASPSLHVEQIDSVLEDVARRTAPR